jgi:hypothetical protein
LLQASWRAILGADGAFLIYNTRREYAERDRETAMQEFNANRFKEVWELLEIEYDKFHEFEREIALASGNEKIALRQRMKHEIIPRLRKLEVEYAQLLASGARGLEVPQTEAAELVHELTVALVETQQKLQPTVPEDIRTLLIDLKSKLDEPGKGASAKLKVTLPIIPTLVSYELGMDTEAVLNQVWRKIRNTFRRLVPDPK